MTLDILVILDRSGSMQAMRADHEGGLRAFIDEQRELPGDVRFTLVQFDSENPCEILYDRTPILDVGKVALIPRGGTPLFDAVGKAVAHLRAKLADDAQVVVMVITDGEENASREWTKPRVQALTKELEAKNWSFLYLGANVDAFAEAAALGASTAFAANYTPGNVVAAYAMTSSKMSGTRQMVNSGSTFRSASIANFTYTDDERASLVDAGEVVLTTTQQKTLADVLSATNEEKK